MTPWYSNHLLIYFKVGYHRRYLNYSRLAQQSSVLYRSHFFYIRVLLKSSTLQWKPYILQQTIREVTFSTVDQPWSHHVWSSDHSYRNVIFSSDIFFTYLSYFSQHSYSKPEIHSFHSCLHYQPELSINHLRLAFVYYF